MNDPFEAKEVKVKLENSVGVLLLDDQVPPLAIPIQPSTLFHELISRLAEAEAITTLDNRTISSSYRVCLLKGLFFWLNGRFYKVVFSGSRSWGSRLCKFVSGAPAFDPANMQFHHHSEIKTWHDSFLTVGCRTALTRPNRDRMRLALEYIQRYRHLFPPTHPCTAHPHWASTDVYFTALIHGIHTLRYEASSDKTNKPFRKLQILQLLSHAIEVFGTWRS